MPYGALYPILDACKSADFVLLMLSATTSIEPGSWGELCLRTLQAQGLPTVLVAAATLSPDGAGAGGSKKAGPAQRAAQETRKSLLSFARYFAPEADKVHALDVQAERSALLRTLATSTPRRVAWRDFRAWLVGERAEWTADANQGEGHGTLKVEGWVRGAPLSANRLVHIPDYGDFEVGKITAAPPARGPRQRHAGKKAGSLNGESGDADMVDVGDDASSVAGSTTGAPAEGDVLEERDAEEADDLVSENEPDDMANEQTWPTEEEMAAADDFAASAAAGAMPPPAVPGTTPRAIKKVPKGTSAYQARWIVEESDDDEDDMEDDEDEEEEEMEEARDEDGAASVVGGGAGRDSEQPTDSRMSEAPYEELSEAEEEAQLAEYRERRQREQEEATDAQFPDEVDTPLEVSARTRFERYRGLKSFRTSPWDPYEDLPRDYARIFQFDDYNRTRRRVEASALVEGVQPGMRVALHIHNVPRGAAVRAGVKFGEEEVNKNVPVPFVLFGLLRHEHKKSVLNFTVTRNTEYDGIVRSKVSGEQASVHGVVL